MRAQRSTHGEGGEDRDPAGAGLAGTLRRGAAGRSPWPPGLCTFNGIFFAWISTVELEDPPTDLHGLSVLT
jgi:hypothetical protein